MEVKTARQQYLARLLMLAYNQYKQAYRAPEPKFYLLPAPRSQNLDRATKMQAFFNRMLSDLSRDIVAEELRRHQQFVENLDLYHRRLATRSEYIIGHEPVSPPESLREIAKKYNPRDIVGYRSFTETWAEPITVHIEAPPLTYERLQEIRDVFINRVITQGLWPRYPVVEQTPARGVGAVIATCMAYRTWFGYPLIDEAAQMPGLEEIDEAYMRSYNAQFGGITNRPSARSLEQIRIPDLSDHFDR